MGSVKPGNLTPWEYLASYKEVALVEVAKTFFVGGGIMLLIGGIISTISALNLNTNKYNLQPTPLQRGSS